MIHPTHAYEKASSTLIKKNNVLSYDNYISRNWIDTEVNKQRIYERNLYFLPLEKSKAVFPKEN